MSEKLKKTLQDYFIDYKQLSKEFSLDENINDYGVVFTEKEFETSKNNIDKILLNIGENYDFLPESKELPSGIYFSKNSLLLNNPLLENESSKIYKDYILRLHKNNNDFIDEETETENEEKYDNKKMNGYVPKNENRKIKLNFNKDKIFPSKDYNNYEESSNNTKFNNKNKSSDNKYSIENFEGKIAENPNAKVLLGSYNMWKDSSNMLISINLILTVIKKEIQKINNFILLYFIKSVKPCLIKNIHVELIIHHCCIIL